MAEIPVCQFQVKILNSEGITLDAIVRTPRVYKPQDLKTACLNTSIIGTEPEPYFLALVNFVLIDYFVLAHRTGLYNRQMLLWQALPKVVFVSVCALTRGILDKKPLPMFDFYFKDYRGRTLILAHMVDPAFQSKKDISDTLFRRYLKRAEKMAPLSGLFFCLPSPFPSRVLDDVLRLTGGNCPVGKYESILPAPWLAPLNLLELSIVGDKQGRQVPDIHLHHPDLTAARRIRAASVPHEELE